ncbi:Retron-type reverse transcriptase [Yersinia aldovae]|uniref:retron St85 family RNA-directed DNA polymerase n=1 Tax=Yersinia aldovae TaxID=29483 RepID=UPI0005DCC7B8|nr:retron St85 family RNA-directed DNA polymerase [Yersinia aldovae]CNH75640.1 Retron-type reverse transcriptase [Yersinia aldovae]
MSIYNQLCEKMKVDPVDLDFFSHNAPKKYKVYSIPKRTVGHRLIAQPTSELKEYQRALVSILEKSLPIHESAYAYRKNIGIKQNALKHVANSYLLKMDFQNFFNKIKPEIFFSKLLKANIEISDDDRKILKNLLFWKPGLRRSVTLVLSVGAPSSPLITNFVMYYFDEHMTNWCKKNKISYTRYADDITFSTNTKSILFSVPSIVRTILKQEIPGMSINESKTIFSSKAHNRHVTGVTLTTDNKISLGRKKKKEISALLHRFTLKILPPEDISFLIGLLSHAKNIEPVFLSRMKSKYGEDTFYNLRGDYHV